MSAGAVLHKKCLWTMAVFSTQYCCPEWAGNCGAAFARNIDNRDCDSFSERVWAVILPARLEFPFSVAPLVVDKFGDIPVLYNG